MSPLVAWWYLDLVIALEAKNKMGVHPEEISFALLSSCLIEAIVVFFSKAGLILQVERKGLPPWVWRTHVQEEGKTSPGKDGSSEFRSSVSSVSAQFSVVPIKFKISCYFPISARQGWEFICRCWTRLGVQLVLQFSQLKDDMLCLIFSILSLVAIGDKGLLWRKYKCLQAFLCMWFCCDFEFLVSFFL